MRTPRAGLALSVLRLSRWIELKDHVVAGRMIDTKKITCALSFELTDFLSMNSHLMDLELLLERIHMLIRVDKVTGE